jgi:hypothetical protein
LQFAQATPSSGVVGQLVIRKFGTRYNIGSHGFLLQVTGQAGGADSIEPDSWASVLL